ncbi:MAG: putative molybdenum carrier protein [Verrucomicrobiota bacterium]
MDGLVLISGGQTGADRAALDAALDAGLPCGGYCPQGRKAEDGRISTRYPLIELEGAQYDERTLKNVLTSDATVIFFAGEVTGGTALTVHYAQEYQRPYLLIDITRESPEEAARALAGLFSTRRITRLNLAGPRASQCPEIYGFVYRTLTYWLQERPD